MPFVNRLDMRRLAPLKQLYGTYNTIDIFLRAKPNPLSLPYQKVTYCIFVFNFAQQSATDIDIIGTYPVDRFSRPNAVAVVRVLYTFVFFGADGIT